jgi:hypothetical protein
MSPRRSSAEDDAIKESALLLEVLDLHPAHLSESELIRRTGVDPEGAFEQIDPWRRAIRELRRDGLLRFEEKAVIPTMAAVRAFELLDQ